MLTTPVYLSLPAIKLAKTPYSNKDILKKVKSNFKGSQTEWMRIKQGISFVFRYCDTSVRYLGTDKNKKPIDYAVSVSQELCKTNNISLSDVGLVIYGGIYREYFEPATAMEIASKLGLNKVSSFDVTNACAGLLQSVQVAASIMQTDERIKYAICCTTDFPDEVINYDIQSFSELSEKSAGLTLGSGAAAWLLSRENFQNGGAKLLEMKNTSIPNAYTYCKVPVSNKKFQSLSSEIFKMGIDNVPTEISSIIDKLDWEIEDVDFVMSHQPGKKIIQEICKITGISTEKVPVIHHLFGDTVNSSVPMTMDHISKTTGFKNTDKLIFNSAAAGFTMLTLAAEWEENEKA